MEKIKNNTNPKTIDEWNKRYKNYNWRYYTYPDNGRRIHVIQHVKEVDLQFESKTKSGVFNKLGKFISNQITPVIFFEGNMD